MYIFLILPFFLVIFLGNTVKYGIILWGKYQEERRQENKKELKKYVLLVVLFLVLCGVDYSLYQHYLDYTKIVSYTKNSCNYSVQVSAFTADTVRKCRFYKNRAILHA